jgi:hypothetical protein
VRLLPPEGGEYPAIAARHFAYCTDLIDPACQNYGLWWYANKFTDEWCSQTNERVWRQTSMTTRSSSLQVCLMFAVHDLQIALATMASRSMLPWTVKLHPLSSRLHRHSVEIGKLGPLLHGCVKARPARPHTSLGVNEPCWKPCC